MIGRSRHNTMVRRGADLPELGQRKAVIGAVDDEAMIKAQVWIRLFAGEGRAEDWELASVGSRAWEYVLPPSLHERVIALEEWPQGWEFAEALPLGQTFCWSRAGQLLMVGLPTEEAWEEMLESLG